MTQQASKQDKPVPLPKPKVIKSLETRWCDFAL
jgi:hypothetical protein